MNQENLNAPQDDMERAEPEKPAEANNPPAPEDNIIVPETGPAVERAYSASKARRSRISRLDLEYELMHLREDLSEGMNHHEIRGKYGWSVRTFWRRVAAAEKTVRQEFNPVNARMVYLKHDTCLRNLQREARYQMGLLSVSIHDMPRDMEHATQRATLLKEYVRLMRFIRECDADITAHALKTGIAPTKEEFREVEKQRKALDTFGKKRARPAKKAALGPPRPPQDAVTGGASPDASKRLGENPPNPPALPPAEEKNPGP